MRLMIALFVMPWMAQAQDVDCADTMIQQEMNLCAQQVWQAADVLLNEAYAAALAVMQGTDTDIAPIGATEEARLRKAQRAWLAYRDAACDSAGFAMRGGSAEPLLTYGCLAELTEQRTQDLQLLIEGY